MTTLFLVTFFVGFGLTIVSALLGAVDAGAGHGHGGDVGQGGAGHAGDLGHGSSAGHAGDLSHGGVDAHGSDTTHNTGSVSAVNFQTIVAFLMGFGGVGYLATRFGLLFYIIAFPLAIAGGVAVATLIFRFMRFLKRGELPMAPTSYVGLVGTLTLGIRQGGTGEMVYTQHGSRQVTAARSESGVPIPSGQEVVVLRYEKGVAYVQLWSEFKDQEHL